MQVATWLVAWGVIVCVWELLVFIQNEHTKTATEGQHKK
jgi:hypothetical protein